MKCAMLGDVHYQATVYYVVHNSPCQGPLARLVTASMLQRAGEEMSRSQLMTHELLSHPGHTE